MGRYDAPCGLAPTYFIDRTVHRFPRVVCSIRRSRLEPNKLSMVQEGAMCRAENGAVHEHLC